MLLAGHVGARLHVCHVSTAGSVEILRWAKGRGVQVTAEVTVDRAASLSLSRNNPWHGRSLRGAVHATVLRGRVTAQKGALA